MIETAISKDPEFSRLNPQVVGAPDAIAGEVPIAVIMGSSDEGVAEAIQSIVVKELGSDYALDEVISARDLSLSDYPRTMAGKIQKTKLAELIKVYRAGREKGSPNTNNVEVATTIKTIWGKALGMEASQVPLDRPVGEMADSITVMRVRTAVTRQTGKSLPIAALTGTFTIGSHIELMEKQSRPGKVTDKTLMRQGPPEVADMIHLIEDPELFEPTKRLVEEAVSDFGLGWSDVADVVPAYDFYNVMVTTRIIDTWLLRYSFVTKKANKIVSF
jgi:hypothetical protein